MDREGDERLSREPYTTPAKDNKKYATYAVVAIAVVGLVLLIGSYVH